MATWIQTQSIANAYKEICTEQRANPWVPLGNFSNDFFDLPDQREQLLKDAPLLPDAPSEDEIRWATFCAASAEYLCHLYHIPVPAWVARYTPLPEAWFHSPAAYYKEHVRERYIRTTPEEFRKYNIFCGNKVYINKAEAALEKAHARI